MEESLFRLICKFIVVTEHAKMTSAMLYARLMRGNCGAANQGQNEGEEAASISFAVPIGYDA